MEFSICFVVFFFWKASLKQQVQCWVGVGIEIIVSTSRVPGEAQRVYDQMKLTIYLQLDNWSPIQSFHLTTQSHKYTQHDRQHYTELTHYHTHKETHHDKHYPHHNHVHLFLVQLSRFSVFSYLSILCLDHILLVFCSLLFTPETRQPLQSQRLHSGILFWVVFLENCGREEIFNTLHAHFTIGISILTEQNLLH